MDFEDLAFSGDGHFMSNRKVNLPPGSQRNSFKVRSLSTSAPHTCMWLHQVGDVPADGIQGAQQLSGRALQSSIQALKQMLLISVGCGLLTSPPVEVLSGRFWMLLSNSGACHHNLFLRVMWWCTGV